MMFENGWTVECADPEVGIFGDLVMHECGTTEEEAVEGPTQVLPETRGWVRVIRTFRCPGCGEETEFVESEPSDAFEEPRDDD